MLEKIMKVIKCPRKILLYISRPMEKHGFFDDWTDEQWLKARYWLRFGKKLDLNCPKTFNEKLQWLKINYRRPEFTTMVDKYEVKQYVVDRIGEEYVIPTLGIWNRFEDIDFDKLPNQFVLKCTHDSGGLVICKDKATLDMKAARRKINNSLQTNFYLRSGREWPYKNVKPRIIAEPYLEDTLTRELRDYKLFTFGGKVKMMFTASDRQSVGEETKFDFFDADYHHIDLINDHPNAAVPPACPQNFQLMKALAEEMAEGLPHVRVDFYEINGKVLFGEFTFYHCTGMSYFDPVEWDYRMGDWIQLPEKV